MQGYTYFYYWNKITYLIHIYFGWEEPRAFRVVNNKEKSEKRLFYFF